MIIAETINVDGWTALVVAIGAVATTVFNIVHAVLSYLGRQKQDAKTDAIIMQNEAIQQQSVAIAGLPPPLPPKQQAIVESVVDKAETK